MSGASWFSDSCVNFTIAFKAKHFDELFGKMCDLDHFLDCRIEDLSKSCLMSLAVSFLIDLVVDLWSLLNLVK